jgi:two-component system OmpR family response regulator/two-component system response regulator MprA
MQLILCEDEPRIAQFIQQGLMEEGHTVTWKQFGAETIKEVLANPYDVLILDLRLPDMSGLDVCQEIRRHYPTLPILILTALDAIADRVTGLRAGADDYLPKPFAFDELLARIEALYRRSVVQGVPNFSTDLFSLDPITKTSTYKNETIPFTIREYELFAYLLARKDQIVSREMIYRDVWQMPFEPNTNVISVYVNYIRQKLLDAHCPVHIESVRGIGYKLTIETELEA